MSDKQMLQQQADTRARGQAQRKELERTARDHRAQLAAYYERQRGASAVRGRA